ncbi:Cytochrome c oxidase copper chaperone 2 [Raphanus sativus]|nr:Cytochrome c oxidase copper chaperone 2 [Raphanus sativus]
MLPPLFSFLPKILSGFSTSRLFLLLSRPKRMSGLQAQGSACSLSQLSKDVGVVAATETKPKKRICCACPDTKKLRDECIVENGESACTKWIEAHLMCLRSEGFKV